jgi:hypothetical protein
MYPEPGGPRRSFAATIIRAALFVVTASVIAGVVFFFASKVPGGFFRVLVGALLALGIATFGVGFFRQFSNPPPAEPPLVDVSPELRLAYRCEVCGMELAVLKVAQDKAPRHCGEEMVLVRR